MNNYRGIQNLGYLYDSSGTIYYTPQYLVPPTFLNHTLQDNQKTVLETSFLQLQTNYEKLKTENEELKNKVKQLQKKNQEHEVKRRFIRRKEEELSKQYACCYDGCKKQYASSLALNLHIKNKHHGGTKKQRDEQAKQVIFAELSGHPKPEIKINLPENYIEEFKNSLFSPPQKINQSKKIEETALPL